MSDSKISGLPAATSVTGTDLTVIVQNGVTKRAPLSVLLAGAFSLNNVATNAAKLALPSNTAAGYVVQITGEANRIEQYLGGGVNSDANWLVLRNSVNITVENDSSVAFEMNGVQIASGTSVNVGWVIPQYISYSVPNDLYPYGISFAGIGRTLPGDISGDGLMYIGDFPDRMTGIVIFIEDQAG